jgi:hypothetical protein
LARSANWLLKPVPESQTSDLQISDKTPRSPQWLKLLARKKAWETTSQTLTQRLRSRARGRREEPAARSADLLWVVQSAIADQAMLSKWARGILSGRGESVLLD